MQCLLLASPLPVWAALGSGGGGEGPTVLKPLKPILDTSANPLPASAPSSGFNSVKRAAPPAAPPLDVPDAVSAQVSRLMAGGVQSHGSGDIAGAQRCFRQVLKLDPRNSDAYYNLGAIAEEQGDLPNALSYYRSALAFSPDDGDFKAATDSVSAKISQAATAAAQAQQLASVQAQQTKDLKALADDAAAAYQNKKYSLAVSHLEKIAAARPADPDVQYGLAQAYRGEHNYTQALSHINKAIAINPGNSGYRQALEGIIAESKTLEDSSQVASQGGPPPVAPPINKMQPGDYYSSGSVAGQPQGKVTPFTASATDGYSPGSMGSVAPGYLTGYSRYGRGYGWGYGGNRGQRALTGALTGAAAGAALGMLFRFGGSPGRGLMNGALLGGATGLLFGGLR